MRLALIPLLAVLTCGSLVLVGCDREVAHEEKVDVKRDGTVTTEEKTVTQRPDGTIVQEETERKTNP